MVNHHYIGTGTLTLTKITPVIQALFGAFKVKMIEDDTAYVVQDSQTNSTTWTDIAENVVEIFGDKIGVQDTDDTETIIIKLIYRFNVPDDHEVFVSIIESILDDMTVDFEELLALANICDDGHGLSKIEFDAAWTSDKPRVFEFGGAGTYLSKEVHVYVTAPHARCLGNMLDNALSKNDFISAANIINTEVAALLNTIQDGQKRKAVIDVLKTYGSRF